MNKLFSWIKQNKLATALLVLVTILLASRFSGARPLSPRLGRLDQTTLTYPNEMMVDEATEVSVASPDVVRDFPQDELPAAKSDQRMVARTSSLSLKVKEVEPVLDQISQLASKHGGFMVDSNLT
ncbi:MAG: DUF4349 domain-containing protein, partial [Candidatus Pacebacteria bacterium]|nr:DUF4349 domain-containing protein [Candidatus Paceibacterota bacterium]